MTQPPNPGQPFYPPQPSAPSAPAVGQPYPPQQQFQGAPSAAGAPGAPGQPYPPIGPSADSFFVNLFDTSRGFVERYGKIIFIVATIGFVVSWFYDAYQVGAVGDYNRVTGDYASFSAVKFFINLIVNAFWTVTQIGLLRLFVELVSSSAKRSSQS